MIFAVANKAIKSHKLQIKSVLVLGRYYEIDMLRGINVHFCSNTNIYNRGGLAIFFFLLFFLRDPS